MFEAFATKILNLEISSEVSQEVKKNTLIKESDILAIEALLQERLESAHAS
jgi:hypothetical protein